MMKLTPRTLGIALIASLAVNLFLAGMFVAGAFLHGPRGGGSFADRPFPHWAARRVLKDDSRRKVDTIWRAARPALRERIQAVRRVRREVARQLRADPIDRAALDKAFASLRDRSREAHAAIQAVLGQVAAALTAGERRDYFRRHRWRGRRGRHGRYRRHERERRERRED